MEQLGKFISPHSEGKPSSPVEGQQHFDVLRNELYLWDGTEWVALGDKNAVLDSSAFSTESKSSFGWTHTFNDYVTGLLVLIVQTGSTSNLISSVKYSGVELSLIGEVKDTTEGGAVWAYWTSTLTGGFTGSGNKVSVVVADATAKIGASYGFSGAEDLVAQIQTATSASSKEIEFETPARTGIEVAMVGAAHTGLETPTVTPNERTTTDKTQDFGTAGAIFGHLTHSRRWTGGVGVGWTASIADDFGLMNVVVRRRLISGPGTAFPSTPAIGDSFTFIASSSKNVYWQFVYDGLGTNPWKKVGGPPLKSCDVGGERSSGTAGSILTTGSPVIEVPVSGEYTGRYGCSWTQLATAGATQADSRLFINASQKEIYSLVGTQQFEGDPMDHGWNQPYAITKGQAVQTRYSSNNARAYTFHDLFIEVDPICVAG